MVSNGALRISVEKVEITKLVEKSNLDFCDINSKSILAGNKTSKQRTLAITKQPKKVVLVIRT